LNLFLSGKAVSFIVLHETPEEPLQLRIPFQKCLNDHPGVGTGGNTSTLPLDFRGKIKSLPQPPLNNGVVSGRGRNDDPVTVAG
jgi:hypothetical protein